MKEELCTFVDYGEVERRCTKCNYVINKTDDDYMTVITMVSNGYPIPDCLEKYIKKQQEIRIDFMKKYNEEHKYCPKCGSTSHSTTLVAYIFNANNPDEYEDLNDCNCSDCGDRHTMHERVKNL